MSAEDLGKRFSGLDKYQAAAALSAQADFFANHEFSVGLFDSCLLRGVPSFQFSM